jgi:hypothetical protein
VQRKEKNQGRSKGGGGQVGPAHPKILLAHPRIKVKHIKNKIHLQYLSIICLWFKIWPTPAKNHCYALEKNDSFQFDAHVKMKLLCIMIG